MSFVMLPPEINSGRMYGGPGSGSLAESAGAWERLAERLHTAAADCEAVTSKLGADPGPHIGWLRAVAAHAERTAVHAAAAVRAWDTAMAAVVAPPVIEANRARRTALAATNVLGQASSAIAECDADYERMWARDAEAMYAYAGASADAATLTPFTSPPIAPGRIERCASRTWAVQSAPDVVSTGRRVMSTIPDALRAFSRSPLTALEASLAPVTGPLSRLSSLSAPSGIAISQLNSLNKAAALRCLLPSRKGAGVTISAGFGRARSIGTLSVPHGWSAAATSVPFRPGTVA